MKLLRIEIKDVGAGKGFVGTDINCIVPVSENKGFLPAKEKLQAEILHPGRNEVDFDNPGSVHTHWKQVEKLKQVISGQVLGYHTYLRSLLCYLPLCPQWKILLKKP